jgi:site-specific recombinase XerD
MGESGLSVAKISAIAGHTDTKTTSRYLHVKTDDIEEYIPKLF